MPYEWLPPQDDGTERLHIWPYRSLPRKGFVIFIGVTAGLIGLPLLAVIGSPVLWGLLPFLALAVAGIWFALQRSYRDGEIVEDLTLTQGLVTLTRYGPRGKWQKWEANPHWVRVERHPTGGPVPQYLTLKGGPRLVELGAFLSEDERLALHPELQSHLARFR